MKLTHLVTANGHAFFVTAAINGVKCRLLLDTGAMQTVIDLSFYEKYIGNPRHTALQLVTGSGWVSLLYGTCNIQLKGMDDVKQQQVTVLCLNHVNEQYKAADIKPIHGLLGADVLRHLGAVLDFETRTLKQKKKTY